MKRCLTGVYLRANIDDKWDTYDIVDLPWVEVEKWLKGRIEDNEFLKSCYDLLLKKLKDILLFLSATPLQEPEQYFYGDYIEKCHQILNVLKLLGDSFDIVTG